ncbi:MAG: MBL fold metallo-hydrolase [Planctomycetota bacterium]|jgi:phosphoribosyl 1,2-cyclic phosphodiesterase
MRLVFWGTRGSIPTPGPTTVKYGGNTPCVEVQAGGRRAVIDAGTGFRTLGESIRLSGETAPEIHLLISHSHWDHIQGFPFFAPVLNPKAKIFVYGCQGTGNRLEKVLGMQMDDDYFPLSFRELTAEIRFVEIVKNPFQVGELTVESIFLNHPGLALGFNLTHDGKKICYCSDTEPFRDLLQREEVQESERIGPYAESLDRKIVEFAKGAEVLIIDGMYTDEEYKTRLGWGHSSISDAVKVGMSAGVKRMFLFHHAPLHTDEFIDEMVSEGRKVVRRRGGNMEVYGAMEGEEVEI